MSTGWRSISTGVLAKLVHPMSDPAVASYLWNTVSKLEDTCNQALMSVIAEAQSPTNDTGSSARDDKGCLYLYLPYLNFDKYLSMIRRRYIIQRRKIRGRAKPIPNDVPDLPLDLQVLWECVGYDPPLHLRRSLDQYRFPDLRDTYARDDDQMLYKLTKEQDIDPLIISPIIERMIEISLWEEEELRQLFFKVEPKGEPLASQQKAADTFEVSELPYNMKARALDGNVLMVDQLWLWALDKSTVTTFFPKRESQIGENSRSQHADLRSSVHSELNGDLTARCENSLDLAALITLHAVTVLMDRTSHPNLDVFRLFSEAADTLYERMASLMKNFRFRSSKIGAYEQRSGGPNNEYDLDYSERQQMAELNQAQYENRETTAALLELNDMEDELGTLKQLFSDQISVIKEMHDLYRNDELYAITRNGRGFLEVALTRLTHYDATVGRLLHRVTTTSKDYQKLLEMIQRKAQVDEVRWSRVQAVQSKTQNLSVVIFTTFTVIFLPLSFFRSLFGMNTSNWAGEEGNSYLDLHTIGTIALPCSFGVISLALIAAFSNRTQAMIKAVFKPMSTQWDFWAGPKDGRQDQDGKVQGAKHHLQKFQTEKVRRRKRFRRERKEWLVGKKEKGYDFWGAVRKEQGDQKVHQIREMNRPLVA